MRGAAASSSPVVVRMAGGGGTLWAMQRPSIRRASVLALLVLLSAKGKSDTGVGDPRADLPDRAAFEKGRALFKKQFTEKEGLGPYFNETSCLACHSMPAAG